jgi:hypothetical protein
VGGHASATIGVVFADGIGLHGVEVKHPAATQVDGGDFAEGGDQVHLIVGAEAQQVGVSGRAVRGVLPQRKEQGAFEQEAVGMGRHPDASQQALHAKPVEQQVVVVTPLLGECEQPGQDGCRAVPVIASPPPGRAA